MKIEKLDHYGRGIAYCNNKICFVDNALIDEDVEVKIVNEKKKYLEAKVVEYRKKSNDRVKPKCEYYDVCGGCRISHLKKEKQEEFKQVKVQEIIKKFTKQNILIEDIYYNKEFGYRNKVVLHIEKNKLGFYKEKTNDIIDIDKCLLLNEKINDVIKVLKKVIEKEQNLTSATIKLGNITNEIMLSLSGKISFYQQLLDCVDVLIINGEKITEKDYIISVIGTKRYKVSEKSFFQVNGFTTEGLYNEIKKVIINNKCKNVLDLYCGTGTIGIFIADQVNKVIGIEVVSDAINDANYNKMLNNVDNITFINGKVENEISQIRDQIDTVILDPPRSGLHKSVINVLEKMNVKNIIYVSCDPVTLSRDINLLSNVYEVNYVKPFDMFPNTYHVECVSVLHRKSLEK